MKRIKIHKIIGIIVTIFTAFTLMSGFSAETVQAAAAGIYIATATPHYRHPQTGVIEDSGGESSEVLGQSMTESATHTQALVEVDSSGNTWVTIRLKLMDNIENPTFRVDGSGVSATLMQENYSDNTADYRMKVGSENSVIRVDMYVVAMGRSVIFYITVSNLQSGAGDFITSISVPQTTEPTTTKGSSSGSNTSGGNTNSGGSSSGNTSSGGSSSGNSSSGGSSSGKTDSGSNSSGNTSSGGSSSGNTSSGGTTSGNTSSGGDSSANTQTGQTTSDDDVTTSAETGNEGNEAIDESTESQTTATEDESEEETEAKGLAVFDESGNAVTEESENLISQNESSSTGWIVAVVAVVVIAGGVCGWYFGFYRKRGK